MEAQVKLAVECPSYLLCFSINCDVFLHAKRPVDMEFVLVQLE